jgi:CheY-like chemotaxis protein
MGSRLTRKSVLVVEDCEDNAELVAFLMAEEGAEVQKARSAREALDALDGSWRPDVLLLDISLPGTDGYELLHALRDLLGAPEVPAIAVTSRAYPQDKERALRAGFLEHVPKPYDPTVLVDLVVRVAGRNAR